MSALTPQLRARMMEAGVRAADPWCGWLRLPLPPLALAFLWLDRPLPAMMLIMAWMMLPMLARKPVTDRPWMSRAWIGVHVWRSRPVDEAVASAAFLATVATFILSALLFVAQRPAAALACAVLHVFTHLLFLARTARCYAARRRPLPAPR